MGFLFEQLADLHQVSADGLHLGCKLFERDLRRCDQRQRMLGHVREDLLHLALQFHKREEEPKQDSGLEKHTNRSRDCKDGKYVLQSPPLHSAWLHKVVLLLFCCLSSTARQYEKAVAFP